MVHLLVRYRIANELQLQVSIQVSMQVQVRLVTEQCHNRSTQVCVRVVPYVEPIVLVCHLQSGSLKVTSLATLSHDVCMHACDACMTTNPNRVSSLDAKKIIAHRFINSKWTFLLYPPLLFGDARWSFRRLFLSQKSVKEIG